MQTRTSSLFGLKEKYETFRELVRVLYELERALNVTKRVLPGIPDEALDSVINARKSIVKAYNEITKVVLTLRNDDLAKYVTVKAREAINKAKELAEKGNIAEARVLIEEEVLLLKEVGGLVDVSDLLEEAKEVLNRLGSSLIL
jgi:septation ring formation regulator EzrA